ncbi:MAG: sensor histidine kinase [Acidobacteriaceae bacterium]
MVQRPKSNAGDYIWLAYSVFFFIEPLVRNRPLFWLGNTCIYLLFLAIYVASVRVQRRRYHLPLLASMALLGLSAFPWNAGASCFVTFAIAFLPFVLESTAAVVASIAVASLSIVLEGLLLHLSWPNFAFAVFMLIVVGTSNIFIAQKKRATARLIRAQDEIERLAALAERERIARDMHDVLGHSLSVIVLKAELARRLLQQIAAEVAPTAKLEAATSEIADIEDTARTALAEVRKAIIGYRSEGLAAELELARRTLRSAGVTLDLDTSLAPSSLHLTATQETVLSLAVREAVTNIVRHAQATTCRMRLSLSTDGFHSLSVEDDGQTPPANPREGNGLRGMRERVQGLGGRLRFGSGGGDSLRGTALLIELPVSSNLQHADPATLP